MKLRQAILPGSLRDKGFLLIGYVVNLAGAEIISYSSYDAFDAYVLSEFVFVYDHQLTLITVAKHAWWRHFLTYGSLFSKMR